MSELNVKWAKEKKLQEWTTEQVKQGKHKLVFGLQGKRFTWRSEWSYLWKAFKHNGQIHIHYGLGTEHKKMSAKIQRRVVSMEEEINKLRKKQQNLLARHWKNAKIWTPQQIFNRSKKIQEVLGE